jgi:ATP-dependent protease HslVU (ClpYQ) ATPase subunit
MGFWLGLGLQLGLELAEESGTVFIDEIDKLVSQTMRDGVLVRVGLRVRIS